MMTDSLQEFVVNPWKVELVGAFFQSGSKKRENDRMPPLVFEDCDVSTICVASDVDTTNDEESGKVVGISGFGRENRQDERDQDETDVFKVGKLMSDDVKSQSDDPSLKRDPNFISNDTDLPVLTFASIVPVPSSSPSLSRSNSSTTVQDSSDWPVSSAKLVPSARPVSSARPVPSARPVSSNDIVSLIKPSKKLMFTSTASKNEDTACISAAEVPGSQVVSMVSPISSTRPTLIKKLSPKKSPLPPPPIPVPHVTSPDQGSTCVSVILKSSRLDPKAARLNAVAKRQRQVEQLVSNYRLKFSHKSSPGVQVRLDYCFHQPGDARQFYKSVTSLVQSQSPPRLLSCILMAEADLGYQHQPVLTEYDLLAIQSPEYCRNLFRTSILIKVVQEDGVVVYHFKTVTDVNRFLYNKSSSVLTRSLGLLRRNVVPKRLIPDDEGHFRLFSSENKISEKLSKKHKFNTQQGQRDEKDSLLDGNYLLFSSKLDLFKFLVSEDAADIEHLQFDGKKIKSFGQEALDDDRQGIMVKGNEASLFTLEQQNERKGNNSIDIAACSGKSGQEKLEDSLFCSTDDVPEKTNHLSKKYPEFPSVQKEIKLNKSVHFEKDKLEMNGISVLNDVKNMKEAEPRKDGEGKVDLVKSALLMKEEEIRSLKKKLVVKEKMIQAEILEKTSAKSSLKEALSQLDKINQLSLSVTESRQTKDPVT